MNASSTAITADRTERLMTVSEVAEWLVVSPGTLYYWRHTHRGPRSLTLHGGVRYRAGDIEAWLERGAR